MLRKKLKKIIMIALLISSLFFTAIHASSININKFVLEKSAITYIQQNNYRPKILIYHSHTSEKLIDGTSIIDVGRDLQKKLTAKGCIVEHLEKDYVQNDYLNAYYHSKQDLLQLPLDNYDLIIDLHTDATEVPVTTTVKSNDVAKIMFVTVSQNPNLSQEKEIINGIKGNLNKFSNDIVRGQTTNYKVGITYYNTNLAPQLILAEIGSNQDTFLEAKRANTYFSSAIYNYIVSKNN